jgi:hypothetical protein
VVGGGVVVVVVKNSRCSRSMRFWCLSYLFLGAARRGESQRGLSVGDARFSPCRDVENGEVARLGKQKSGKTYLDVDFSVIRGCDGLGI